MKKNGVKGQQIVYGFVDESGTAGAVNGSDNFLIATIVLFDTASEVNKISIDFDNLRQELQLRKTYEFHSSRNNDRIRKEVYKIISKLNFRFMTFAIEKDNLKKRGSYANLAKMIVDALKHDIGTKMEVVIDENPTFLRELNKAKKIYEYKNIYFSDGNSKNDNRIQLVDYLVDVHSKIIKGDRREKDNYNQVRKKLLRLVVDRL